MELIYEGSKGGDKEPHQPVETPNNLLSVAYAKVLLAVAEGELAGTPTGRDIYLNGTPLLDAEGNSNFGGVTWDWRPGTQDQTHIQGMPDVSNEITVGVELRNTTPWVREITKESLDAVRVTFQWPALQKQQSNGDTVGYTIDYAIDLSTDGGPYVEYKKYQVSGKTNTDYERTTRVDLPPASSGWTLRVRRITPNSQDSLIQDTMNIKSYAEVSDVKQRYPNTALLFVQFDSRLFGGGQIPKISVKTKGRLVRVPTNYNPTTRAYSGIWDGSFKWAYTNNPAWVFFDIVTQNRFGLGSRVKLDQVDKWELYEVAQYCDVLVDDGTGAGTKEPRHTCNMYIQSQTDAWSVLRDIGSIFNGMTYWDGNKFIARADKQEPLDNIPTFSRSSVINGEFNYQTTDERTIFTSALVSYDEPADHYGTQVEAVWEKSQIQRWGGDRQTTLAAIGCTSRGEAQRKGKYTLLTNMFNRSVSFRTGLQGLDEKVRPGAIIGVADPLIAGKEFTGRLMAATLKVVTLDRITEAKAGDKLFITRKDGSQEARTIQAVADKVVTLTTNYSEIPKANSVWYLESEDLKSQLFKIVKLKFDGSTVDINAVEYNDSKFAAIDNGARLEPRPISKVPPQAQKAPTPVIISSNTFVEQMQAVTTMTISWPQTTNAVLYEGQWRVGSGDWVTLGTTGATQFNVKGVYTGQYLARVRAINALGVKSSWTLSVATDLNGKVGLPPALVSLEVEPLVFGMRPNWKFPSGVEDTARTELFSSVTPQFANATKQGDFAYPQESVELNGLKAGATLYFWARLIDKSGNVGPWYPSETGVGVQGLSSTDVDAYEEYFKDQINNSALGQELAERVDLIDGPATLPGSVNQRVEEVKDQVDQVNTEVNDRIDATNQLVAEVDGRVDTINQQVGALNLELDQQVASLNQSITQVNNDLGVVNTTLTNQINSVQSDLQGQIDAIDMSNTLPYDPTLTYTKDQVVQGVPDRKLYQAKGPVPINTAPPNTTYWLDIGQAVISADGLAARVTKTETDITEIDGELVAQANRIDGVQTALTGKASVQAVDNLTTRVTTAEGTITAQGQAITGLTTTVNNKADASAVNALTTRVTTAEGKIDANSTAITNVQSTVNNISSENLLKDPTFATSNGTNVVAITVQGRDIADTPKTAPSIRVGKWSVPTLSSNTYAGMVISDNFKSPENTATHSLAVTTGDVFDFEAYVNITTARQVGLWIQMYDINNVAVAHNWAATSGDGVNITTELNKWVKLTGSRVVPDTVVRMVMTVRASVGSATTVYLAAPSLTKRSGQINAQASATSSLETRVTTTEQGVQANATAITGVQSSLADKADASAVNSLTTRVTTAEGNITSQGQAITALNTSLTTTNGNVTAAQNAANAANTLAGGKGKVFYGTAAPAVGEQLPQNLWIDTNGGANTPKRWNGSAWVAVTDKVATDAAAAAANALAIANTKADASAVTSLTTRVTTVEGTVTSQGQSITSLNNNLTVTNGNVTAAAAAAQAASDLAGGKGEVIYSTSTPATAKRLPQNLWIDITGNANTPKRWNGSAWVVVTDKIATDAAAAAANALALVVTKADASAVTALTSTVTQQGDLITAQGTQITTINTTLDNISGNGSNLVPAEYSVFNNTPAPVFVPGGGITAVLEADPASFSGYVVKMTKTSGSATVYFAPGTNYSSANIALKNKKYIVSFYAKAGTTGQVITTSLRSITSAGVVRFTSAPTIEITDTWARYSAILDTTSALFVADKMCLTINPASTAAGYNIPVYIDRVMLEEQVSTGTTPSTFSIGNSFSQSSGSASAIQSLDARVTQAEGTITSQGTAITSLNNSLVVTNNNVTTAQNAAQAASDLAGGKGKVLTQSTTPAVADRLPQNLWIDTTGNANTPKRWNGTAWVAVTDKVATDAAAAAASALSQVATKADASALTALTTRVTNAEGTITSQGSSITQLNNSLTTTNTNVTAAQNAANAANTLAGGKGEVIYGSTTPAVDKRLSQNLWIDTTNNNNTPKRWNGSAWVVVTDKVATDAAAAAANALAVAQTKADASAVTALTSTVTQQGETLVAQGNQITSLSAGVNNTTQENVLLNPDWNAAGYLKTQVGPFNVEYFNREQGPALSPADRLLCHSKTGEASGWGGFGLVSRNGTIFTPTTPGEVINMEVTMFCENPVAGAGRVAISFMEGSSTTVTIGGNQRLLSYNAAVGGWQKLTAQITAPEGAGQFAIYSVPDGPAPVGFKMWLANLRVTRETVEGSVAAKATSQLDARVTSAEGNISSNSSSITSLTGSLTTTNQNVTAAQNAANAANTLAGGKGKVLVQTATPAVADQLSQNLWIDMTGGANTPKRWTGSTWSAVTDKVATDAAAAAANALSQVATKADASTVTALSNTVTAQENTITAQGNSITTIKATVDSIGGNGSNLNPSEYSVFGETNPPLGAISTGLTAVTVADSATLGAYALKFTSSSTSTTLACYLHASNTVAAVGSYPISYVNGKYIVSFYAKANVAGRQIRAWLRALNSADSAVNATSALFTLTETWTRYSAVIDLSNVTTFSGNKMVVALQPNTSGISGTEIYLDRVMVEKQIGASGEPSVFDAGSSYTSSSAQGSAINSLTSRVTTAEGTITSQGTAITSLNNSLTTTNQTVATKADSSTVTALSNTVTQQGNTITSQGNSLTSIQASVNSLGASGVNLLPAEYSVYNSITPQLGGSGFSSASVVDSAALRGYALKVDFTSSSTGTTAYFAKGFNGPDANMSMKPQKYIISYYAKASVVGHVIAMYLKTFLADNVTGLNSAGATQQPLTTNWARYSYVVDISSASFTGNQMMLAIQPNRSGVANRTVWLDRVMVEPVTGSQTDPSVFSIGPSADQFVASAAATSALDARVTQTETGLTTQAGQITTLTTGLAGKADASALNSLSATVTQQGTTITSQGTAVTQLQNTVGGIGGNGSNLIDSTYSWLGSTTLPQMTSSPIATTITSVALTGPLSGFGYRVVRPVGANPWIMFTKSNNAAGWNTPMTKGTYLMSFYANTNAAGVTSGLSLNTAMWDGSSKGAKTQVLTATRTRYTQVITITADNTVGSMVVFMPTGAEGDVFWIDSIMLEKQLGTNETASPFTSGPTGNEVTGQATAISTLDTKVTNVEGTVTAQATRLDGIYVQVNPVQAGDTTGYAGSTGSLVGVWSEQSARIEDGVATGQKIDTVQAQMETTNATVQQTSTAVAGLDGKVNASWSVKLQVNSQGQYEAAGVGLGIENGPAGLQSTFLVNADRFAVVNGVDTVESTPFVVSAGQVFIKDAFIKDASITNAKIGQVIQSDNYIYNTQGWAINKNGGFEMNGSLPGQGRMQLTSNALKFYHANGVLGIDLSL